MAYTLPEGRKRAINVRSMRRSRPFATRRAETLRGIAAVEPAGAAVLTRPDGTPLGRRRVVARAARIHVQDEPFTEWAGWDLSG
ncbi:hypothetical protein ABZT27_07540 [Streptomyces sp. NPDC005389]|uniref:hypothetical protein n=1 Tax=unclassified Streptomyces TaxID=2593676 RepID=UPI0033A9DBDE